MEGTILYLVRHCESDRKVDEDLLRPLTDKGREQAAQVTEHLRNKAIAAIYSSDTRRTLDTIDALARATGLVVRTDARLREGVLGCPREENPLHSKRQWSDPEYRLPQGESLSQVQGRMRECLYEIVQKERGRAAVVCTHGTAICTLLQYFCPPFGWEQAKAVKKKWPWVLRFEFDGEGRFVRYEEEM